MNSETEAAPASPEPGRTQTRRRSAAMWVVLVIAGLLLLLSAFAVWINRVALNTSVFTDTSTSLLDDDAIRSAIATRAVDELYDNVDVQAELRGKLPKDVKSLSGPAAAALRQASYTIVDRALERPELQKLFKATLEQTHETLVQVLKGGGNRVSTQNGEVTLDLRTIVLEAADRIGIGAEVANKIPRDAGRIVVLRSDQLDTAQNVFELLKTLAWVLPLLTIAAFALAVWLAGERRRAIRGIGITFVVVGVLGLLAATLTRNYVVNSLVAERSDRQAANDAWDILTDLMRGSFRLMIVVGILFIVAGWLAGSGQHATSVRRWLAPALQNRLWAYVALAVVGLFLIFGGNVADFTRFLVVVLLLALGVTWIELTRAQTLREFPDAGAPALVSDARSRVSDWLDERRASGARREELPPKDVASQLAGLADLHAQGKLTDEEYAAAKAQILGG
jgi:hypothetical protein